MKPKTRQKLLWLVHHLTGMHERYPDKHWIELRSRSLKAILGWGYPKITSEAVSLGFIEHKRTYLVGKRCKSFRLVDRVFKPLAWSECTDATLKANILSERIRKSREARLRIASSDLDAWLYESLLDVGFRHPDGCPACEGINEAMQALLSGTPDYAVCPYGRRHTPFTRLPSDIRSTVFFRSDPQMDVVEIDIINSQPVFLLVEIMHNLARNPSRRQTPDDGQNCDTYTTTPPSSQPLPPLCVPVSRFKQDIEDGELYDRIMKEINMVDRKAFKEEFFHHILFGPPSELAERKPVVNAFMRLYPEAWVLIKEAKADDYRELARRMQRREADFVFKQVLPRYMKQHPASRILTVHDALYCEDRHKYDLINILNEEFAILGVRANLRVTALAERQRASEGRSAPCVAP